MDVKNKFREVPITNFRNSSPWIVYWILYSGCLQADILKTAHMGPNPHSQRVYV